MAIPLLIPPFVQALTWIFILAHFGISTSGFIPACLVMALSLWPLVGFMVYAGLKGAAGHQLEAAQFHFNPRSAEIRIELGLLRPHLFSGALLVSVFSLSDYAVPSLFRVNTYPVVIFSHFAAHHDLWAATWSCWPYLVLPLLIVCFWHKKAGLDLFSAVGENSHVETCLASPGRFSSTQGILYCLLFLSVLVPLIALGFGAGGLDAYKSAWRTAHEQILISIGLAAMSATIMMVLSLTLSSAALYGNRGTALAVGYGALLPMAIPGTLCGISLILLWNRPWTALLHDSFLVLIILYAARFLPLLTLLLLAAGRQIDKSLVEAGAFSQKPWLLRHFRIPLPLLIPVICFTWLAGFVLSLHEVTGALLVTPPGIEPLAIRIYSLYHYGAGRLVSALSLAMVGAGLLAGFFCFGFLKYYWHAKNYRT